MRIVMLLLAIVLLTSCTTAHAATPTPAPAILSVLKANERATCQLVSGEIYQFTPRIFRGNWVSVTDITNIDGDALRPMWLNTDHLSLCWTALRF